jgi:hypothetical protein
LGRFGFFQHTDCCFMATLSAHKRTIAMAGGHDGCARGAGWGHGGQRNSVAHMPQEKQQKQMGRSEPVEDPTNKPTEGARRFWSLHNILQQLILHWITPSLR